MGGAPWQGSKMASWIHMICSNQTSSKMLRWLAKELNYCDTENPGVVYRAYETLKPDFPGLEKLATVANGLVSRALCGASTFGLQVARPRLPEALCCTVLRGRDQS